MTVYEGDDPTCTPHVYTADTANNSFVDIGGGDVHLIRNETGAVAQTMAVQFVPAGATRRDGRRRIPATAPSDRCQRRPRAVGETTSASPGSSRCASRPLE